jgi:abequosyltransferase
MNNIKLSVCIPTYNFGSFIGDTLRSITKQLTPEIEIVVFDGGSNDGTGDIVAAFQKLSPSIKYHRSEVRGGIDNDMARTVSLAVGKYCWLVSSDDALRTGAIQRILEAIKSNDDIYLCNRTECDKHLAPLKDNYWLSPGIEDCVFSFSERKDFINYFNSSQSIGALFSYMSSIIVHREKWNAVEIHEKMNGSNYAHVFRLFRILQQGGTLTYIKDPLILCRGDNDSFMERGLFNRNLIDFNGYHLLAVYLFDDHDVQHAFLSVVKRYYKWYHFVALKKMAPDKFDWTAFEDKLFDFGYSRSQLLMVRVITSHLLYSGARYLWHLLISCRKMWSHSSRPRG